MKHLLHAGLILLSYTISAQNIGLLTQSPQAPVHIASSGQVNTPGGLLLLGDRLEGHLEMDFNLLQSRYGATSTLPLMIQPSGGYVGINSTFPQAPLHIGSSGQVNTTGGLVLLGSNSEGHMKLDFDLIQASYGAASFLPLKLQPEGGSVGINTSFPTAPLHVFSNGGAYTTGGLAVFGNPNLGHLEVDINTIQAYVDNGPYELRLQPYGGDVLLSGSDLVVDASANRVGIMDITPSYTLDVNGNMGLGDFLYHKEDNDTYFLFEPDRIRTNVGGVQFLDFSEGIQDLLTFGNGSNINLNLNNGMFLSGLNKQVGVGSSFVLPTARLHVSGSTGESALKIDAAGETKIHIKPEGEIVIGTPSDASPDTMLVKCPTYMQFYNLDAVNQPAVQIAGIDLYNSLENEITGGHLAVGYSNGAQLRFDGDEIQAVGNTIYGALYPLSMYLNSSGGNIILGKPDETHVGIQTYSPLSQLHIRQFHGHGNSSSGLRIEFNNDDWRMAMDTNLHFYYNNVVKTQLSSVTGNWIVSSDRSLKKNIESLAPVLDKVNMLNPVQYHMLSQNDTAEKTLGFIAQEVMEIYPDLVEEMGGKLALKYDQFGILAIKAIQELSEENSDLKDKYAALSEQYLLLNERLTRLESLPVTTAQNR